MKVVILAGGLGTRISEETISKPKPMIKIGNKPILWHIMKCYAAYGINEFIICCGYKGNIIKDYFKENKTPWELKLVNTGLKTMTGGRLKKVEKYLDNDTFCFTYGDTLNDVNITKLIEFHKSLGTFVTITACQPTGKFGILNIKDKKVIEFIEKPKGDGNWVNGGYFVLEPSIFDYINNDSTIWEQEPLQNLTEKDHVSAFKHQGFYQPMDTMYDKKILENMWNSDNAKWKSWN